MEISVSKVQARVPVSILRIQGDLDASNYHDLIERARSLYAEGTRDILLDLSQTPYVTSSGLVALHTIAQILNQQKPIDLENGWAALHAIAREPSDGQTAQQHVQLLSPQPKVVRVLQMAGLDRFFRIHTDLDSALAAF